MKKRLLILLSVCFICVSIFPSSPKYEMRAVWITTNWGLDWPSRPVKVLSDRYIQQKELCYILDELQSVGIITIVFLGGVQLFTIGILGEYIGNIFDETKNRPEYIIDKKINFDPHNNQTI